MFGRKRKIKNRSNIKCCVAYSTNLHKYLSKISFTRHEIFGLILHDVCLNIKCECLPLRVQKLEIKKV